MTFCFRVAAVFWLIIVKFAITYNGGHYFTDIIAVAALGSAFVWCSHARWLVNCATICKTWENKSPATFYSIAFFLSYQIATFSSEVRVIACRILIFKRIF